LPGPRFFFVQGNQPLFDNVTLASPLLTFMSVPYYRRPKGGETDKLTVMVVGVMILNWVVRRICGLKSPFLTGKLLIFMLILRKKEDMYLAICFGTAFQAAPYGVSSLTKSRILLKINPTNSYEELLNFAPVFSRKTAENRVDGAGVGFP